MIFKLVLAMLESTQECMSNHSHLLLHQCYITFLLIFRQVSGIALDEETAGPGGL